MIRKFAMHYQAILVFKYDSVIDCSISFEPQIRIYSGMVTFNMFLFLHLTAYVYSMIRKLGVSSQLMLVFKSELSERL
jgi:hypothetical protein